MGVQILPRREVLQADGIAARDGLARRGVRRLVGRLHDPVRVYVAAVGVRRHRLLLRACAVGDVMGVQAVGARNVLELD